jgi:hypothetical protein
MNKVSGNRKGSLQKRRIPLWRPHIGTFRIPDFITLLQKVKG